MPLVFTSERNIPDNLRCSLFGQWIFRNLHKQESWERIVQTALTVLLSFTDYLAAPGEAPRIVWHSRLKFVLTGHTEVWTQLADTSTFFFLIIIILEPQTSIIIFCDYYFLPLIISVTLHTDLWKLAPYFKRKRKKKVCYSIVCYKRTIDCGMQFKDDICQQMPCIIWHCRDSNLFLFWK